MIQQHKINKEIFEELENGHVVCQSCLKIDKSPSPVIPLVDGDVMKGYCHVLCAFFSQGKIIKSKQTFKSKKFRTIPINLMGFEKQLHVQMSPCIKINKRCSACRSQSGPYTLTVKCHVPKCQTYMHPICAIQRHLTCYRSTIESEMYLTLLKACEGLERPAEQMPFYKQLNAMPQHISFFKFYCKRHQIDVVND